MMICKLAVTVTGVFVLILLAGCEKTEPTREPNAPTADKPPVQADAKPGATVYQFSADAIDGNRVDLSRYRGKVLLIVNVASKCGNTPQYAALEEMYKSDQPRGLVILGFPANDFGQQEPGTNGQILAFCRESYGVTFPMFAKISVKDPNKHPLYAWLTDRTIHPQYGGEIGWNFTKFLIGRDGKVVGRFEPKTTPTDPKLVQAVEAALAKQ